MKSNVKILAHFPVVILDQNFSFIIISLPFLFKAKAAPGKLTVYYLVSS
jgi:hypothetical protein